MSQSLGSLVIVLHGHLPYVLHHGRYPHGEAWLYEAAAETYMPLLDIIGEAALLQVRPALTIGLTPVLLEQLAHERFKSGFVDYLKTCIDRAVSDRREFERANQLHFAYLATRWEQWYGKWLSRFEEIGRDIPGEYARRVREGHIQVLTSNATHAYMPLLLNDECLRAQMSAGQYTSKHRLGFHPRGMWLPECAYRPSWGHWMPPVLYDNPRHRVGLEYFIGEAGVTHFFVDSHMVHNCKALGVQVGGDFRGVDEGVVHWDSRRAWRSPLEPVGVCSEPGRAGVFALARHPGVSEQVWSGWKGYPGTGNYLEFHKKHGERGLRYWKITSNKSDLGSKDPYYPDDVPGRIYEHAAHFCNMVRDVLRGHFDGTGRRGVCVAPFDAELFGHWWFEGPQFLRDVILTAAHMPEIDLLTAEEALYRAGPDKVVRLPEGSWGEGGDHRVWINDKIRWYWEMEFRAENKLLELLHKYPWTHNAPVRELLERAGRELLLLQASDWPFVIYSQGAVDYGIERAAGHALAFDRLVDMADDTMHGRPLSDLQRLELQSIDAHDNIFPHINLRWWMPPGWKEPQ